jgi:hypothetical protein
MASQYRLMTPRFYATVRNAAGNMKQISPLNQPFMHYQCMAPLHRKSMFADSGRRSFPLPFEA